LAKLSLKWREINYSFISNIKTLIRVLAAVLQQEKHNLV